MATEMEAETTVGSVSGTVEIGLGSPQPPIQELSGLTDDRSEKLQELKLAWRNSECDPSSYDIVVGVLFLLDGKEVWKDFPAHKLVLGNASEYLAPLVDQISGPGMLEIRNLTPQVMELVLQFIYTDQIDLDILDWQVLGGMSLAAQHLRIPGLSQYCNEILKTEANCDTILSLFTFLTSEECGFDTDSKYPSTYYWELLKMCYVHILETAEDILRASGFLELTLQCVEMIIQSDFLNAEEAVVYGAVEKWAISECARKKLSPSDPENLREVLRKPGEDQNSIGILDKVRFLLLTMDDFQQLRITEGKSLLPVDVSERVCQAFLEDETLDIFPCKKRVTASSCDKEDLDKNLREHAERFANAYFDSTPYPTVLYSENRPASSENVTSVSQNLNNDESVTFAASGKDDQDIPMTMDADERKSEDMEEEESYNSNSSLSSNQGCEDYSTSPSHNDDETNTGSPTSSSLDMKEFVQQVDVDTGGNADILNLCHKKIKPLKEFLKHYEGSRNRNDPGFIQDCIQKCLANCDREEAEEWANHLRLLVSNYLCYNENVQLPPLRFPHEAEEDASSEDATSKSDLCPSPGSPESSSTRNMTVKLEASSYSADETTSCSPPERENFTCFQQSLSDSVIVLPSTFQQFHPTFTSSRVENTSTHEEVPETTLNRELPLTNVTNIGISDMDPYYADDEVPPELFVKNSKMKYSDIISACRGNPHASKVILQDIEIDDFTKKLNRTIPAVCLSNIMEFQLHARMTTTSAEPKFKVPPENFIFFYKNSEGPEGRLGELWSNSVKAKLVLNGVTRFNVVPIAGKLTLNYATNSTFDRIKYQRLNGLSSLTLSNFTISQKHWLEPHDIRDLKSLGLYFYSFNSSLRVADPLKLKMCPLLENLALWPNANQTPKLCLSDLNDNLKSLAVNSHLIKSDGEPGKAKNVFPRVESIAFRDCSWDNPNFAKAISELFPNLRVAFISGQFNQPSPALLQVLLKMETMQEIVIGNLDLKMLDDKRFSKIKALLTGMDICKLFSECTFKLVRASGSTSQWRGKNIKKKEFSRLIFDSFAFKTIYTYQSWKDNVWDRDMSY